MFKIVHRSLVRSSYKSEVIQMFTNSRMDKQVVHIFKWNTQHWKWTKMDYSHKQNQKWKKQDTKENTLYDFPYTDFNNIGWITLTGWNSFYFVCRHRWWKSERRNSAPKRTGWWLLLSIREGIEIGKKHTEDFCGVDNFLFLDLGDC